jgi:hypothetical protein
LLKGNPGKHPARKPPEPARTEQRPALPEHLTGHAREAWLLSSPSDDLLDGAEAALSPDAASDLSTFLGAATILLREGLEALLIVVAMIAFLRKAER